jgi:hypothetical protein
MEPGFYVVRVPAKGPGTRLIVESVCFPIRPVKGLNEAESLEWVKNQANGWCEFIQGRHPKDDVFVIERPAPASQDSAIRL